MANHTVEQGEYLGSIAARYGFKNWRTIYEHPQNQEFRKRRPNPNVIYPGDVVFIPDKDQKTVSCATGESHDFRVKTAQHWLKIILKDSDRNLLQNVDYRLAIGDQTYTGNTGTDGRVNQKIPVDATEATLTVEALGLGWNLKIGHLDPVHDDPQDSPIFTGVKARLKNLGFYAGEVDDELNSETQDAVKRFQEVVLNRTDPDGQLDSDTREALLREHGS